VKTQVALADLPTFCKTLSAQFKKRQIVLLSGPLGAGKTQFVKACVKILGGLAAESPTFSIINEYEAGETRVYHADLYRLTSSADIESTGFWDLFSQPEGLIFVEWPEQAGGSDFPVYWAQMKISVSFTAQPEIREFNVVLNAN
jgi:tRNA threonylcarbamoyladenosine biosynthesis protein TsaE